MESNFTGLLAEQDYLAILAFNKCLSECRHRHQLNELFKMQLLPLLNGQACFYCFSDPDFSKTLIIDAVNIPQYALAPLQKIITTDPIGHLIIERQRPVLTYDLDIPRQLLTDTVRDFSIDYPEQSKQAHPYFSRVTTVLAALNLPDATIGFAMHRLEPNEAVLTAREARIFELIQPALWLTIRSLFLTEELNRYRTFAESLTDISSPVTMLDVNWKILFKNRAFDVLFPAWKNHTLLPERLVHALQQEMKRYRKSDEEKPTLEIPFCKFDQTLFRLNLTRIEVESQGEMLWLLRINRVTDAYSEMLCKLQEACLTSREIEVCIYIRDGFEADEIAERLYISYHTVRNHLRSIYTKTGVNTRAKLITYLNKNPCHTN